MKGSCLCGQVRYEADALASPIQQCSCHSCRKAHAAAFNTGAAVRLADFRWLAGEELLSRYESSPGRVRMFCSCCGSQLIKTIDGRDTLVLRVATLDEDPGQTPQQHIWVSHQVPWLQAAADIPVWDEWPPK
ncbi:GFA family protein [Parathalassolituus penaei]|uniref:GFA family protein n=1 Tax=Parathalassolituus penaei TaxID=2997323 RepID=A0A9X3EEM1_9GAMM|nr:GFA family protein [Parathalassolituus penaei]MCY0966198.1 GFA family protein [Parathalassolituus penaei]